MTYDEAMEFWFGRVNFEMRSPSPSDLHLDRIRTLLQLLGRPEERFRIVHIAGSKGKGSTAAFLASVLRQAGYHTGLFTSPHLVRVEERIQVEGEPITTEELALAMTDISQAARNHKGGRLADELTFFEIATALGFLHFARRRIDVAVVEVGLGGRFDSTNVCNPVVSIITSISFDHVQQLGNTLEKIAFEKSGIIKPGRPVVSGVRAPEARAVIEQACEGRGARLVQLDKDFDYRHEQARISAVGDVPAHVQVTTWRGAWPRLPLGLIGEHQARNAAAAVAAAEVLRGEGLTISDHAVAEGLATVRWPARMEICRRRPLVVLDCAHNVASAQALAAALEQSFPPASATARRILLFAGSQDKDLAGMLRVLTPAFNEVILTRFSANPRSADPDRLAPHVAPSAKVELCASAADAWKRALAAAKADDLICVTGSVFLAGELRPTLLDS